MTRRREPRLREKGYSIETTERLYWALSGWEFKNFNQEATRRMTDVQCVRDVLCIHAKTGMHGMEIERLVRGEGKVAVLEEPGEIAATVTFIHKSGNVHRQSIDRQTLAAVQRLQARGAAPVDGHIRRVVGRACKELGIEPVRFGEYRHSFVTWASECGQEVRPKSGGLPLTAIAAVVGHHSANTTKRFLRQREGAADDQDPHPVGASGGPGVAAGEDRRPQARRISLRRASFSPCPEARRAGRRWSLGPGSRLPRS